MSVPKHTLAATVLACGVLAWAVHPAAVGGNYHLVVDEVRDLGTLSGHTWSEAHAINEGGALAGSSESSAGSRRAVYWASSTVAATNLGHLGGQWSEAWGMNDAGTVVGNSRTLRSNESRGFRWTPNTSMTDLGLNGSFLGSGTVVSSTAEDINNNGAIVGYFRHEGSAARGYLLTWGPTIVPHCDDPGSYLLESRAQAINDEGLFTGHVDCAYSGPWLQPYRASVSELTGIGPTEHAGGDRGYGIDATGRVVGGVWVLLNGGARYHAFRWSEGAGLTDIHTAGDPTFNSVARGINAHGLIVGSKYTANHSSAFVYGQGIGMTTLPALCQRWAAPSQAYAVNDSGWVVGGSTICSGEYHATLWKVRVVSSPIL